MTPGRTRDLAGLDLSARERGKRERRSRVVDAAEALIREGGEVGFSMRELADRSGLSLATPFNLFGSKTAVLSALVERAVAGQLATLAELDESDPLARVLALAERAVRAYTGDQALYRPVLRALVTAAGESAPPPLLEVCTELWREALRDAEAAHLLDPSLDVDLLARQLHLAYRAGLSLWVSGETDDRGWLLHVLHGVALVLLGAATDAERPRLRARLGAVQQELLAPAAPAPAPARRRAVAQRTQRRRRSP